MHQSNQTFVGNAGESFDISNDNHTHQITVVTRQSYGGEWQSPDWDKVISFWAAAD